MFGRGRARADQRDQGGRTPLHYAAVDGRLDDSQQLVEEGADLEAQDAAGLRPLHFAAMYKHAEIVDLLLGAGAEVDPRDSTGNTPLWHATMRCNDGGRCITLLRGAGADPYAVNANGHSPIETARRIADSEATACYADLPVDAG